MEVDGIYQRLQTDEPRTETDAEDETKRPILTPSFMAELAPNLRLPHVG